MEREQKAEKDRGEPGSETQDIMTRKSVVTFPWTWTKQGPQNLGPLGIPTPFVFWVEEDCRVRKVNQVRKPDARKAVVLQKYVA